MHKTDYLRSLRLLTAFLAVGYALGASSAQAGFQWVAPQGQDSSAVQSAPVGGVSSVQIGDMGAGMPVVEIGGASGAQMPSMPAVQIGGPPARKAEGMPVVEIGGDTSPTVSSAASSSSSDIVQGFADRVPLSVALRQVLPPSVGFSVAQDVSLGTLVSWKGGSAWKQVLKDMLLGAGLSFTQQDTLVHITKGAGPQLALPAGEMAETDGGVSVKAGNVSVDVGSSSADASTSSKPVKLLPSMDGASKKSGSMPVLSSHPSGNYLVPPPGAVALGSSGSGPVISSPRSFSAPQQIPVGMSDGWVANKGDMLKEVLENWCRRAGVEMNWQSEFDYPVQATVSFNGNFEMAVRGLLVGFQEAEPQPVAYLYNNQSAGQTALVVQARGNNYNQ